MANIIQTWDKHLTDQVPAATILGMDRHRMGISLFLVAALASFLLSIALWFTDNRDEGVFVGLWVPSILAAGGFWITAVRTR